MDIRCEIILMYLLQCVSFTTQLFNCCVSSISTNAVNRFFIFIHLHTYTSIIICLSFNLCIDLFIYISQNTSYVIKIIISKSHRIADPLRHLFMLSFYVIVWHESYTGFLKTMLTFYSTQTIMAHIPLLVNCYKSLMQTLKLYADNIKSCRKKRD